MDGWYLWIKAAHIIAVICWMVGILYLPRLFIYHREALDKKESAETFEIMEKRLLKIIMNPSMIATWVFGIVLLSNPSVFDWTALWPVSKLGAVLCLSVFHMWCGAERKRLANGDLRCSSKTYRLLNEIPAVLLVIIVISVIVRPF